MAAGSKVSDYRLLPDGCHATTEQEYSQFWNETANSYDDFVAEHAPQMHKLIPQLLLSYQHKYNVEVSELIDRTGMVIVFNTSAKKILSMGSLASFFSMTFLTIEKVADSEKVMIKRP